MKEPVDWTPLPEVDTELYVGMIKELLENNNIPSWIKLSPPSAGLSWVSAPKGAGKSWRILVPRDRYDEALEIYEQIVGPSAS